MKIKPTGIKLFLLVMACIMPAFTALAEDVIVETSLDKQEAVVGESIDFQIIVRGTSDVEDTGYPEMDGFSVTYYGKKDLSSTSISVVGDKVTQSVEHTIVCQYMLIPQRTGNLTVPPVTVRAGGKTFKTDPLAVRVTKATETSDYRLRAALSKNSCYVGEKVTLTVTWYFSRNVQNPVFNVPAFDSADYSVLQPDYGQDAGVQYVSVNLGSNQIRARFNQASSGFSTVVLDRILVPKTSGDFTVPAATVQFQGATGRSKGRDFFGREVPEYRQFVIPSNALTLKVLPVPQAGKPVNYSGLIGTFALDAVASPTEVRVGDPITLTLTLRGQGNIEDARLPALDDMQALTKDFKIPKEMAPGDIGEGTKTYTQTLRALRPDVTSIPPIEIPYFNSRSGKYEYARSPQIKISVSPSVRDLTAADMEGNTSSVTGREVEVFAEGIAHNYVGPDVLATQTYGLAAFVSNPVYVLALFVPLAAYIALLAATRMYNISRLPKASKKIAKALGRIRRLCAGSGSNKGSTARLGEYLDSYKEYIGLKLGLKGASITFRDIERPLGERGLSDEERNAVKEIFTICEAASYAGGSYGPDTLAELSRKILSSVSDMERSLR